MSAALVVCSKAIPPAMAQSTSITGLTQDTLNCMKKHTRSAAGWIVYEGSNSGQIKVYAMAVGQVGEVAYSFDANQGALNLTYLRGPASLAQIQSGLSDTANKCKNGDYH